MSKKNLDISHFEDDKIRKKYPCGEKCVGVPYTNDFYLKYPDRLSTGKTRIVEGPAAEKIANNVKKFDEKEGVLSKVYSVMKKSFSK